MAVSKKETVKTAAAKAAEVKKAEAEPKTTAEPKTAVEPKASAQALTTAKKPVEKMETAKKEAEPNPEAKKAEAKKADPKTSVVIEFGGNQIKADDILAAAKKSFTKANKGVEIETMEIYVKPQEGVAYYVVNGIGSDDYIVKL